VKVVVDAEDVWILLDVNVESEREIVDFKI
jgi:hypothetical protein